MQCSVRNATKPQRSTGQHIGAALSSIVPGSARRARPHTLATKSTREAETAILEGHCPQLGVPYPGNRDDASLTTPL